MPRAVSVLVLTVLLPIFGVLLVVEGLFLIPALGLYLGVPGSATAFLTVIGSLAILAGILYVLGVVGLWKVRRWGWALVFGASLVAVAYALGASVTAFDPTRPITQLAVAGLTLGYLMWVRSAFWVEEAAPGPRPAWRTRFGQVAPFIWAGAVASLLLLSGLSQSASVQRATTTYAVRTVAGPFSACWSIGISVDANPVPVDEAGTLTYQQCGERPARIIPVGRCDSGLQVTARHRGLGSPEPGSPLTVEVLREGQVVHSTVLDPDGPSTQFVRYAC